MNKYNRDLFLFSFSFLLLIKMVQYHICKSHILAMNDFYLGPKYERVKRLAEWDSPLLQIESAFRNFLSMKNPGCFGWGSDMSLHNIGTTVDMLGRSSGLCCTHNRLIWIDQTTSEKLNDSTSDMSISSKDLPSWWWLHACTIRSHLVAKRSRKNILIPKVMHKQNFWRHFRH